MKTTKIKHFLKRLFKGFIFCCTCIGVFFFSLIAFQVYSAMQSTKPLKIEKGTVLRLDLNEKLHETRPNDLIGSIAFGDTGTISDIIFALKKASKNENIETLIAYAHKTSVSLTQAEEIRNAVLDFKKAGKKTIFYAPTMGELGGGLSLYYLASAFDEIIIQPTGDIGVSGIAVESLYLKDTLQKFGIKPSFFARYEYKTGVATLAASNMSKPEKENLTSLLSDLLNTIAEGVSVQRNIPFDTAKELLKNGPYFAQQALDLKLIDRIEYVDALEQRLKLPTTPIINVIDFAHQSKPKLSDKALIAYVPAVGIIQYGDSVFGGSPNRSILGVNSFSSMFRKAADNEKVKAIVVRLDSPGGGFSSSDMMRQEIEYVKKTSKKPIVCSMGSVSASGGYFASLGCDKVIADKTTLTGSIGVFGGKLVFEKLLKDYDVNIDTIRMGKNAGMTSAISDFTPEQQSYFNASLDRIYKDFTHKVAHRRGFTESKIDTIARGRVFTGKQALDNNLIDEIGGIYESVKQASLLCGSKDTLPVLTYPKEPTRMEMFLELLNSNKSVSDSPRKTKALIPAFQSWVNRILTADVQLLWLGFNSI